MKGRFILLLLAPWLIIQCQSNERSGQLVVEGSITAGEPVENISVRLVDDQGLEHAAPVTNADVRLLSSGITYNLMEISENAGHYAYYGDDLEIVAGQEYMLWVQHENAVAVTSTVIKADAMAEGENQKDLGHFVARN